MAIALFVVPLLFVLVVMATPSNTVRPWIVILGGAAPLAVSGAALFQPHVAALGGWLVLGPFARLVIAFVSPLFFLCCIYARGYLALYPAVDNRVFCAR